MNRARRRPFSLSGRLLLLVAGLVALHALLAAALHALPATLGALGIPAESPGPWIALLAAAGLTLPVAVWAVRRFVAPVRDTLRALSDGIESFEDRDFGVRLARRRDDELGDLVGLYNRVGEILQEERSQIRQRELLLQTALHRSPTAIVLVNALDRVLYANREARTLFLGGGRLEGRRFAELLDACPAEMRQVFDAGHDGLFSVEGEDGERETYHLAQRRFSLNRRPHLLVLLRRMTSELNRREVEIWKRVIRIISHELRNSLAPISSLAHSARTLARGEPLGERLEPIFASMRERVDHLTEFLERYARYARLPEPRPEPVELAPWLDGLRETYPFERVGALPAGPARFDPAQLQQVLINLLKNAVEASDGDPRIELRVDRTPDGRLRFEIADRGRGMDEDVLRRALLPFYSTKQSGSGVGLPLCREIVEAHGGTLRLQGREGGGTVVSFWLPAGPAPGAPGAPGDAT